MALIRLVIRWLPAFVVLVLAGSLPAEDVLPLPQQKGAPVMRGDGALLKPNASIQPPPSICVPKVETKTMDARELALMEMERKIIEDQARKQIAAEAKKGSASALKQLIVMLGPVDAGVGKSLTPPVSKDRIALIGLEGRRVERVSVEQFFGAPLTPEREQQLLDAVKLQLTGKDGIGMEVKIAGWWPEEGVMAVSVLPWVKKG